MCKEDDDRTAQRFLDEIDVRAARDDAEHPHSVIAYDPMTSTYTVKGPYPDAHTATLEAELYAEKLNRAVGHPGYPPIRTWIAMHFFPDQGD